MKLSIIISCYNFEDYIGKCIECALDQDTDFDYEVIVVDDCSTDSSYEVIRSFGDRIVHSRNESNLGPLGTMARLFQIAKGEYVSHIDGDDFFTDPLKSQKQVDFLEGNPEYSMHSTGCMYGNEDGTPSGAVITPLHDELTYVDLMKTNFVGFGRTFRNYGNLSKEWMRDVTFLDWCMNFEIALRGKVKCETWPSGIYRLTGKGMITSLTTEGIFDNDEACRKALTERLKYKDII
jgi:glycosyltransferase involved in cell wall biosynthesis